ncbi:hypothetical protein QY883_09160 [Pediococcus acidilactici]|nr:hypothetical protein [Pediococcus acidilactici]MDB8858235.1 hypothetical protein [Pediococcus acidilactici]MDL2056380.1 hypothetical protein [Pediococcus acidilactici]MDQ7763836.1 hypothetical protein [Pediococcus acidilactici]UZO83865.1 hypothetical protein HPK31_01425 [Pediococcus acidilactici]
MTILEVVQSISLTFRAGLKIMVALFCCLVETGSGTQLSPVNQK